MTRPTPRATFKIIAEMVFFHNSVPLMLCIIPTRKSTALRTIRPSTTIADLAGSEQIKTEHLAEAIQYRSLDRDFFV